MGCGIPVLGNTDGALETIVRSEFGWPCAKLDEEEIARQLKRALVASSEELASMGKRARAWVEQHRSFSSEAAESVAFYENLLSR
jgi:glycosyltransferase involved in cell wall biosynthesis